MGLLKTLDKPDSEFTSPWYQIIVPKKVLKGPNNFKKYCENPLKKRGNVPDNNAIENWYLFLSVFKKVWRIQNK